MEEKKKNRNSGSEYPANCFFYLPVTVDITAPVFNLSN
jgi:hypothetical protein